MRYLTQLGAILISMLGLIGCAISPQEERSLGEQSHGKIEQQLGGLYPNPEVQQYVQRVGMNLARVSEEPNLQWQYAVVNSDEINAFALPGGYVYITKGLLFHLDNEAQLAAILGHETTHVTHHHTAQQIQRQEVAQAGATVLGQASGNSAISQAAGVAGGLILNKYSRDQEKEADLGGLQYMAKAGYDPHAMLDVMQKLQQLAGSAPIEFLSDHPNPANREQYLDQAIHQQYANVVSLGKKNTQQFQQSVLQQDPAAVKQMPQKKQ